MTTATTEQTRQQTASPEVPAPVRPVPPSREEVTRQIVSDSQVQADEYVDQSIVPFGGE